MASQLSPRGFFLLDIAWFPSAATSAAKSVSCISNSIHSLGVPVSQSPESMNSKLLSTKNSLRGTAEAVIFCLYERDKVVKRSAIFFQLIPSFWNEHMTNYSRRLYNLVRERLHAHLFPVREMPCSLSRSLARACSTVPGSLSCRWPLLIKFNWLTLFVTVVELPLLPVLELLGLLLSDWSSSCSWTSQK